MLFSRLLKSHSSKAIPQIFKEFEDLRRTRIDAAVDEANFRWETVKDKGWFVGVMMEWLTALVLWWSRDQRMKSYQYDVRDIELPS
jgi:uncharacterized membrane protein